jgi:hypothetical protein
VYTVLGNQRAAVRDAAAAQTRALQAEEGRLTRLTSSVTTVMALASAAVGAVLLLGL